MAQPHDSPGEAVKAVLLTDDALSVDLMDGRTIAVPLAWYPKLLHATPHQRGNWSVRGGGYGIHWPDLDEDLGTEGLLRGAPVPLRASPFALRASAFAEATADESGDKPRFGGQAPHRPTSVRN